MWGFLTVLNDMLIPHLKEVFTLSYTEAMLVQFSFFGAYFVFSLPSSFVVTKIGYKSSLVLGLGIMAVGAFSFYPSAEYHSFGLFLGALFMLGVGITLLQVSANPYVNALGPAHTASSRMTLSQAFNSLGAFLAPQFGAYLILGEAIQGPATNAHSVQIPYVVLGAILTLLAGWIYLQKMPHIAAEETAVITNQKHDSFLHHPHLLRATLGIFLYVGAEVAIGSLIVSFLSEKSIADLPVAEAGKWVSVYWGLAMVGRFAGSYLLNLINPKNLLTVAALAAAALALIAINTTGWVAAGALLCIGLFNSIMFPTIFSFGLERLGPYTSKGSGIMCMAIVGGAVLPLLAGNLADQTGHLPYAFLLPVVCYGYIAWFGQKGSKS
jgi:FHS family L-fucose permease-like MFS transporter